MYDKNVIHIKGMSTPEKDNILVGRVPILIIDCFICE